MMKNEVTATEEKWLDVVSRANQETEELGISLKAWCRQNSYSYKTVTTYRTKFIKKGLVKPHQRTEDEWITLINRAIQESEEQCITLKTWCERNKVNYSTLVTMHKILVKSGVLKSQQVIRSDDEWLGLIVRCSYESEAAGITIKEWCKNNNVTYGTLLTRRKKFAKKGYIKLNQLSEFVPESEWLEVVLRGSRESEAANISFKEWCAENGVKLTSFYAYRSIFIRKGLVPQRGAGRGPRFTDEEWLNLAKEFTAAVKSGAMANRWCAKHGVSATSLYTICDIFRSRGLL